MPKPASTTFRQAKTPEELADLLQTYLDGASKRKDVRAVFKALAKRAKFRNAIRVAMVSNALQNDDRFAIESAITALRQSTHHEEG